MNRTRKLMTAVTTSLLFTGTLPGTGTVPAFGQAVTQPDESWKTDPQVKEAADAIAPWMSGTPCQYDSTGLVDKTKTQAQDNVVKQFSQFDSALVQKALKYLVYNGALKQMGDGSKDNPFCYCTPSSHSSHGG